MEAKHKITQQICLMDLPSFLSRLQQNQKRLTASEFKALIRERALYDFEFFCRYFFPHYCELPFSRMHTEFCKVESDPFKRGRREVVAAPRNHAKTTFKALFKVVHAIVYHYEPFVLIASYSLPQAAQKVKDVLQELTYNPRLIEIYGALAPLPGRHYGKARWGNKDFTAQNGIRIMAVSRGQSLRGIREGANRPSMIICDDVEKLEGVYESKQREKTLAWFQKDILKLGQANNSTNIVVVGTVLHSESLLATLLKTPGWSASFYQAVEHFPDNATLWDQYKALYTNLSNPQRVEAAHTFYLENQEELLRGSKVLWPQSDPYEKLIRMQIDEGMASFQSEKQNEPFDSERQIFDMTKARRFRLTYDSSGVSCIEWLDGSNKRVPYTSIQRIIAFHDPALASSKQSDYAAIAVVGEDEDGYLYCLDMYLEKVAILRQMTQAYLMQQKWQFEKLYLETNNFQGVLRMNYKDMAVEYPNQELIVVPVDQTQNKEKRISTLEPLITNGHLVFADTLPEQLISQLHLFPSATHDDGPDALQGAVAQLKRLPKSEPILGAIFVSDTAYADGSSGPWRAF